MKAYYYTLGCKVNRYETEKIKNELESAGISECENIEDADIILINSCTVTSESDRKTRQLVRRCKHHNETAIIILTGCMPQAFPDRAKLLPADIIIGNREDRDVISAVNEFLNNGQRIVRINPHDKEEVFSSESIGSFGGRTRAYMKIEDGCNRGCTYCIIPKARGRVRSRLPQDITLEAKKLAEAGFAEIVLVGINLSSYGKDINRSLVDAVNAAAEVEGILRVRLGSLEPDLTDEELLDNLKKTEKFCPQFHLALQSGCNETLKRMNRLYTAEEFSDIVKKIRDRWENAAITTDIMVGFAGETEEQYLESLKFAEKTRNIKAQIIPYSIRTSTAAAGFKNQVPEHIKALRAKKMAEICDRVTAEVLEEFKGLTFNVLTETKEGEYFVGHSENYTKVYIKAGEDLLKKIVPVKIEERYKDGVLAKPVG